MTISEYEPLKYHFDRLMLGEPINALNTRIQKINSGLEPIRTTYEKSFGININSLDVYETNISLKNNPVSRIITLVGPFGENGDDYPCGVMYSNGEIVCVNHFSDNINRGLSREEVPVYAGEVYAIMDTIVSMDQLCKSDLDAINNPYITLLKSYPFYFMVNHLKSIGMINELPGDFFLSILEKYILYDRDDIKMLMDSLLYSEYSNDPEVIYYQMTCGNRILLFD